MEQTWKKHVLNQIIGQSQILNSFSSIFEINGSLIEAERALTRSNDTLVKTNGSLNDTNLQLTRRCNELEIQIGHGGSVEDRVELAKKQGELSESLKSIIDLKDNIQKNLRKIEEQKSEIDRYVGTIDMINKEKLSLENDMKERDKFLTLLKLEIQNLQIDLIKGEDNINDLKKENNELTERWMKKI